MIYHLRHTHNITNVETESDQNVPSSPSTPQTPKLMKQPTVDSYIGINRSVDEWLTRLVVLDGISLRTLAYSEYLIQSRSAMRLKQYKSHVTVAAHVVNYIKELKQKTVSTLKEKFLAGERFSVMADEWTGISNKRYMNVILTTNKETFNLGLVRCKGSITAPVARDLIKVSIFS